MKTYDKTKFLLQTIPQSRDSDKVLIWEFWRHEGWIFNNYSDFAIEEKSFMKATSTESICRARRMIQSKFPELQPTSEKVRRQRGIKEATKGTFIFREDTGQGKFI